MKIAVFVSGGGTNLQAIIDQIKDGRLKNVEISIVIASNDSAYALQRAADNNIPSAVMSVKSFASREEWDDAVITKLRESGAELIVLAGYLSLLGPKTVKAFSNRIINIHPALIPSFCQMTRCCAQILSLKNRANSKIVIVRIVFDLIVINIVYSLLTPEFSGSY